MIPTLIILALFYFQKSIVTRLIMGDTDQRKALLNALRPPALLNMENARYTPLIETLPVDGPNLTTDTDWLVTLSLDIPQYPGHAASFSLMALQDCQQKNNNVIHN
jgi:hypothetical protein